MEKREYAKVLLYRSELDATNTRIRRAIDRHQPGEARRSIEQIGVAMAGRLMDLGNETDPIREAFAKRRELDHGSVKNLYAMLTPEQVAQLPKIPARKNQPFVIEKWSGGVPD